MSTAMAARRTSSIVATARLTSGRRRLARAPGTAAPPSRGGGAQPEHGERRQRDERRRRLPMMGLALGGPHAADTTESRSAEPGGVGVEQYLPLAAPRQADAVALSRNGREVG